MSYDKYDTNEIIEELERLVHFMDKMQELLIKYELKYNLKYDSTAPSNIFNRMCLLVEYLDKKVGVQ